MALSRYSVRPGSPNQHTGLHVFCMSCYTGKLLIGVPGDVGLALMILGILDESQLASVTTLIVIGVLVLIFGFVASFLVFKDNKVRNCGTAALARARPGA